MKKIRICVCSLILFLAQYVVCAHGYDIDVREIMRKAAKTFEKKYAGNYVCGMDYRKVVSSGEATVQLVALKGIWASFNHSLKIPKYFWDDPNQMGCFIPVDLLCSDVCFKENGLVIPTPTTVQRTGMDGIKEFDVNFSNTVTLSSLDLKRSIELYSPLNVRQIDNFECDRMLSDNGQLYIPVTTEHIKFNKYMKGKVFRNFWKNAHTFISLDIDSVSTSGFMFGKYPAIYRKRHIPAFSDYDFAIAENRIYVTFEADPLIYVMDLQGNGIGSFGVADKNIAASYPSSHSFEDYEMNSGKLKSEYGYYDRIYADGRYIMRTCRRDDGTWVMQVYNPANELVALYDVGSRIEIIGQYDGLYYAVCGVDMENEKFMLLRFKL